MHQLVIDFNKTWYSFRREAFYNILIEFGIPLNPVTLRNIIFMKPIAESGYENTV
jgi:hypothetical protein